MKKLVKTFVITALAFFVSCNNSDNNSLAAKKAKMEELKKQQQSINAAITTLQAEIDKLDSNTQTVQAKIVTLDTLRTGLFKHYIDLQGNIESQNISYVAPGNGVGGLVKAIYVKKGDYVRKGQLLLRLDDAVYSRNLQQLQTQLNYAEDLYRRQKNLWDQQIGTELQLNQAKLGVDQLKDQIATLKEQKNQTNVYADVSGVADQVNIRVGELFTGVAGQTPQIEIVNNTDLKVTTNVPENYLDKVGVGNEMIVKLPDLNASFNTTISLEGKTIDPNSRAFYVEARLPADKNLRPNQVAVVSIKDYESKNAITVPLNVVQSDQAGKFVMVAIQENGKMVAHKKPVQIGQMYNGQIEILSGLQTGDLIISDGYLGLYEGLPITNIQ
ncbi:MAG: efflux RND transporter periplasmic adaptor subunit [Bacteroidetes bacterium]|nr:efflux RND transporter periplasmic adaptor subunit [Bacteroidota bacterium]